MASTHKGTRLGIDGYNQYGQSGPIVDRLITVRDDKLSGTAEEGDADLTDLAEIHLYRRNQTALREQVRLLQNRAENGSRPKLKVVYHSSEQSMISASNLVLSFRTKPGKRADWVFEKPGWDKPDEKGRPSPYTERDYNLYVGLKKAVGFEEKQPLDIDNLEVEDIEEWPIDYRTLLFLPLSAGPVQDLGKTVREVNCTDILFMLFSNQPDHCNKIFSSNSGCSRNSMGITNTEEYRLSRELAGYYILSKIIDYFVAGLHSAHSVILPTKLEEGITPDIKEVNYTLERLMAGNERLRSYALHLRKSERGEESREEYPGQFVELVQAFCKGLVTSGSTMMRLSSHPFYEGHESELESALGEFKESPFSCGWRIWSERDSDGEYFAKTGFPWLKELDSILPGFTDYVIKEFKRSLNEAKIVYEILMETGFIPGQVSVDDLVIDKYESYKPPKPKKRNGDGSVRGKPGSVQDLQRQLDDELSRHRDIPTLDPSIKVSLFADQGEGLIGEYDVRTGEKVGEPLNLGEYVIDDLCVEGDRLVALARGPEGKRLLYFENGQLMQDFDAGSSTLPRSLHIFGDYAFVSLAEESPYALRSFDLEQRTQNKDHKFPKKFKGNETYPTGIRAYQSSLGLKMYLSMQDTFVPYMIDTHGHPERIQVSHDIDYFELLLEHKTESISDLTGFIYSNVENDLVVGRAVLDKKDGPEIESVNGIFTTYRPNGSFYLATVAETDEGHSVKVDKYSSVKDFLDGKSPDPVLSQPIDGEVTDLTMDQQVLVVTTEENGIYLIDVENERLAGDCFPPVNLSCSVVRL